MFGIIHNIARRYNQPTSRLRSDTEWLLLSSNLLPPTPTTYEKWIACDIASVGLVPGQPCDYVANQ